MDFTWEVRFSTDSILLVQNLKNYNVLWSVGRFEGNEKRCGRKAQNSHEYLGFREHNLS